MTDLSAILSDLTDDFRAAAAIDDRMEREIAMMQCSHRMIQVAAVHMVAAARSALEKRATAGQQSVRIADVVELIRKVEALIDSIEPMALPSTSVRPQ